MAKTYDMLSASDFMIQSNRYQKEEWMRINKIGIYGGKSESEASTPYQDLYSPNQISSPAMILIGLIKLPVWVFRLLIIYR